MGAAPLLAAVQQRHAGGGAPRELGVGAGIGAPVRCPHGGDTRLLGSHCWPGQALGAVEHEITALEARGGTETNGG